MSRAKADSLLSLTESFFRNYLQRTRGDKRSHCAGLPRRTETPLLISGESKAQTRGGFGP